jgi:hypothetical protein
MDTSISPEMQYTTSELRKRGSPEDLEVIKRTNEVIAGIIEKMRPELPYLTSAHNIRKSRMGTCHDRELLVLEHFLTILMFDHDSSLILMRDGALRLATTCHQSLPTHLHLWDELMETRNTDRFPVGTLLESFGEALKQALAARQERLDKSAKRLSKLDEMLAVLKK